MRSILKILVFIVIIIFTGDFLYADQVFTDSDLQKYGGENADSAEENNSNRSGHETDSDAKDEQRAIQLCRTAISSGITVQGRHSGVKSVKLTELTPSTKSEDLIYIISFDAHLELDIISAVECWVYKKEGGQLVYRIISKE